MSVLVVKEYPSGDVEWWFTPDHDYEPESDETVYEEETPGSLGLELEEPLLARVRVLEQKVSRMDPPGPS